MEYQEKIGEYLLRMSEIRTNQVENVLLRQQCGDRRRFGEIAVDLHYIDQTSLDGYLNVSEMPLWKKNNLASVGYSRLRRESVNSDCYRLAADFEDSSRFKD